jgi:hypothetical protein
MGEIGEVNMRSRGLRFIAMMAVAAGVPYAWFSETLSSSIKGGWQKLSHVGGGSGGSTWPVSLGPFSGGSTARDPNAPAMATSIHDLTEILRFDRTSRWVTDNWPRVSTVRAERDLVGLRVPVVTGTNIDDFAGSLTYYFDARQQLRRITLHGQTGDDAKIVELMTKHFGLHPEPSLAAGIYLARWNAKPMNVLRVSHAPVIRADAPHEKLIVELELNDLRGGYGLSAEFNEILIPDQDVRAWNT